MRQFIPHRPARFAWALVVDVPRVEACRETERRVRRAWPELRADFDAAINENERELANFALDLSAGVVVVEVSQLVTRFSNDESWDIEQLAALETAPPDGAVWAVTFDPRARVLPVTVVDRRTYAFAEVLAMRVRWQEEDARRKAAARPAWLGQRYVPGRLRRKGGVAR